MAFHDAHTCSPTWVKSSDVSMFLRSKIQLIQLPSEATTGVLPQVHQIANRLLGDLSRRMENGGKGDHCHTTFFKLSFFFFFFFFLHLTTKTSKAIRHGSAIPPLPYPQYQSPNPHNISDHCMRHHVLPCLARNIRTPVLFSCSSVRQVGWMSFLALFGFAIVALFNLQKDRGHAY